MKNNIVIISGPSGAGEDSIINGLEKLIPIERVITTTTRRKRKGESEGRPYYFVSKSEFEQKIKNNEMFEYAQEYNDNYYGVSNQEIQRVRGSEKIGIWKIEYKGVKFAKEKMENILAIFVNAPLDDLEERIKMRDGASDEYVAERMAYTREWLAHKDIYDYEVVNEKDKLDKAVKEVLKIIQQEHLV